MAYNADGLLTELIAINPATGGDGRQVTRYVYGTAVGGATPMIYRNDLLRAEIYPDSTNEAVGKCFEEGDSGLFDRTEYRYNRLGEAIRKEDQNETVHEYAIEPFRPYLDLGGSPAEVRCGRLAVDRVTLVGPGVDTTVRRIETQHDLLGRVATVTSFDAPTGGNVLNQVVREYTGFGRLAREYQEHGGVKDENTLYVEYDYAGASSGLRPVSLRYPNGRLLHYTYGATNSTADVLGRLDAICDDSGGSPGDILAQYTYLGLDTVVIEDYAQPQVKLDLWGGTSAVYQGFDAFGRVVDHRWRDYAFSVDADRIQHGYDRASNRLWRANPVAAAQNPAVYLDELYQYDGVSQLVGLERGQLSAGRDAVTTKTFGEDWGLDATGNWTAFRQDANGDGAWDLDQTRAHNRANEITSASSWTTAAHDRAGNMTSMPKPGNPADALATTFDAWNRMVKVEDGENTVAEYAYTGDNRRAVKKVYSGGALSETRHFYYTDQWQAIEERTALGDIIATDPDTQYVWGTRYVDHLILRDRQTTTSGTVTERLYALRDANWNVTALVDILGNPLERFTYTAYGTVEVRDAVFQPTAGPSAYAWPYTYTTRRLDKDTGLMYYRNRMYHAELGRFVSRDPVGYGAGNGNLLYYCAASPTQRVDAYGMEPESTVAGDVLELIDEEMLDELKKICGEHDYQIKEMTPEELAAEGGVTGTVVCSGGKIMPHYPSHTPEQKAAQEKIKKCGYSNIVQSHENLHAEQWTRLFGEDICKNRSPSQPGNILVITIPNRKCLAAAECYVQMLTAAMIITGMDQGGLSHSEE